MNFERKKKLSSAIIWLQFLLQTNVSQERKYQEFLENNDFIFEILGYKKSYPCTKESKYQLPKDNFTNKTPEPDFLVEKRNGLFEIFEIKTPQEKLFVSEYRQKFSAKIDSYITQVIEYHDYFKNPQNLVNIKNNLGFDIQSVLDIKLLIGRDDDLDKKFLQKSIRDRKVTIDVVTYDELLSILQNEYESQYGICENHSGLTYIFVIKFTDLENGKLQYFFDNGNEINKNRASLYIDETNDLCFSVFDSNSKNYITRVDNFNKFEKKWIYLLYAFANVDKNLFLNININNDKGTSLFQYGSKIDFDNLPKYSTLGCDIQNKNFGSFEIIEWLIYNKTLTYSEKYHNYSIIVDKHQTTKNKLTAISFSGMQFMYMNSTSKNEKEIQQQGIDYRPKIVEITEQIKIAEYTEL